VNQILAGREAENVGRDYRTKNLAEGINWSGDGLRIFLIFPLGFSRLTA